MEIPAALFGEKHRGKATIYQEKMYKYMVSKRNAYRLAGDKWI